MSAASDDLDTDRDTAASRGDAFRAVARGAALRQQEAEEPALDRELLVVWLGDDPYAVPVERVREIVRLRPITPVPRVPAAVRGVVSLRGEIVQVIDLRRRLGLPAPEGELARERIVVLHGEGGQLTGLLVDRVSQVLRLREETIRPPTGREAGTVIALAPVEDHFVSIFDVDRLLDVAAGARDERG